MGSPDLYKVLGVRRNASARTILRAYWRLAKEHHPDHNPGDTEAAGRFARVRFAFDVLSDPDRRARYDATGEAQALQPDRTEAEVMGVLVPLLASVPRQLAGGGRDARAEDVVGHLRAALDEGTRKVRGHRAELEKVRAALEATRGRFDVEGAGSSSETPEGPSGGGGENLLACAARHHLARVAEDLKQVDAELARMEKAAGYLKRCRYRVDPVRGVVKWALSWA